MHYQYELNNGEARLPKSASLPKKATKPDIFERLRSDILRCHLRPGSRLPFKDCCRIYSSGISQLREAMMRLVADGLIVFENNKGFTVAPVSREELADIVRLRSQLETMAIGMAMEKGDLRWEANIMARYHEVSRLPVFDSNGALSEQWDAANGAFHQALYAACGSPLLMSFCDFLRERYYRYRRLWAKYGNPTEETEKDHKNLLTTVLARDAVALVPLVRSHFERTANSIFEHWSAPEDQSD